MYTVYVLKSQIQNRFYVGVTQDISERLHNHNRGSTASTKPYRPWQLIHQEGFISKVDALARERQIKSYKSGEAFKRLLGEVA